MFNESYLKGPINFQIFKSNFFINYFMFAKNNKVVNIFLIYRFDDQQMCRRQIDKMLFIRDIDRKFIIY